MGYQRLLIPACYKFSKQQTKDPDNIEITNIGFVREVTEPHYLPLLSKPLAITFPVVMLNKSHKIRQESKKQI